MIAASLKMGMKICESAAGLRYLVEGMLTFTAPPCILKAPQVVPLHVQFDCLED